MPKIDWGEIKPATVATVSWVVVLYIGMLALFAMATQSGLGRDLYRIQVRTRGLISPQLIYPLFATAAVLPLLFLAGGLRPLDIGWRIGDICPGGLISVVFWIEMQIATAIVLLLAGHRLVWNNAWNGHTTPMVSGVLSQMFGNAFIEESLFRGFLMPQLYLRFTRRWNPAAAWCLAITASQFVFVISHIPRLAILDGMDATTLARELSWVFRFGIALCLAYLITKNLFFCVYLHAVWNSPLSLTRRGLRGC